MCELPAVESDSMKIMNLVKAACAAPALVLAAAQLLAQTPAPAAAPAPLPPLQLPNPHHVIQVLDIEVNRPAPETWKRIGSFCQIGEWNQVQCELVGGDGWAVGSVRLIRHEVFEVLVGRTALSYTYAQPARVGVPYNLYHGTLEALPIAGNHTKLIYTLFWDDSMMTEPARAAEVARRKALFTQALKNMKVLAEGGTKLPTRQD
jgi:hypothetical protein